MSKNSKEDLSKKIAQVVAQATLNLDADDPSIIDEVIVCQHRLLENYKETIDTLKQSVALWCHKFDIIETRLKLKEK